MENFLHFLQAQHEINTIILCLQKFSLTFFIFAFITFIYLPKEICFLLCDYRMSIVERCEFSFEIIRILIRKCIRFHR